MKKLLFTLFVLFVFGTMSAQTHDVDLYYNVVKNYEGWKKNSKVHITAVEHTEEIEEGYNGYTLKDSYNVYEEGSNKPHILKSKFEGAMDCQYNTIQDLWDDLIISNVLVMLQKKGPQINLREEMEENALDYIAKLKYYNQEFNDPYLENYLYSLVAKIAPATLVDSRPGNVNIIIFEDDMQNAFTFSNGTIVITTGLLASLHTEDELVAILSHEIAHFVLDHSIDNVNAQIKRQKKAEFWAGLATVLTAVGEVAVASKNEYYVPGAATYAMAQMSLDIANQIIDYLGIRYNQDQEFEADEVAKKVLKLLNYDPNALATALSRIRDSYDEERSHAAYFNSATHPSINSRIDKSGEPSKRSSAEFEKLISFAVTSAAISKYNKRRFRQVMPLVEQNIKNGVATADDYILKANCLLALKNDPASNSEAMQSIMIAKELSPNNINLYKSEIIATLRLKQKAAAQQQLQNYIIKLEDMELSLKDIQNEDIWRASRSFISEESSWASKMLIKLKGM